MQIERSKDHKFTILDLWRFESLRKITLVASAVHFFVSLEFFIPAFIVDKYELGLYISGLAVGFSEFLAYPLCYVMISKYGRRKTSIVGYSISLVCAILLFFAWDQGSSRNQSFVTSIFVLVLVFIFRFVVTVVYTYLFVYIVKLFPTQVRVLGTGVLHRRGYSDHLQPYLHSLLHQPWGFYHGLPCRQLRLECLSFHLAS